MMTSIAISRQLKSDVRFRPLRTKDKGCHNLKGQHQNATILRPPQRPRRTQRKSQYRASRLVRAIYNNKDRSKFDVLYHDETKSANYSSNFTPAPYRLALTTSFNDRGRKTDHNERSSSIGSSRGVVYAEPSSIYASRDDSRDRTYAQSSYSREASRGSRDRDQDRYYSSGEPK